MKILTFLLTLSLALVAVAPARAADDTCRHLEATYRRLLPALMHTTTRVEMLRLRAEEIDETLAEKRISDARRRELLRRRRVVSDELRTLVRTERHLSHRANELYERLERCE